MTNAKRIEKHLSDLADLLEEMQATETATEDQDQDILTLTEALIDCGMEHAEVIMFIAENTGMCFDEDAVRYDYA